MVKLIIGDGGVLIRAGWYLRQKPVGGRSDPVRGKFPGSPLQIPPCIRGINNPTNAHDTRPIKVISRYYRPTISDEKNRSYFISNNAWLG